MIMEMKMVLQVWEILYEMMMICFFELDQMLFHTQDLELLSSILSIMLEMKEPIFVGVSSKILLLLLRDKAVIFELEDFQLEQAVLEPFRCWSSQE